MDFGDALYNCTHGERITRDGWNAEGMYVVYMPGYPDGIAINEVTAVATGIPQGSTLRFRPYLLLLTAQEDFVPWVPSISDILAVDWRIVT